MIMLLVNEIKYKDIEVNKIFTINNQKINIFLNIKVKKSINNIFIT